MLIEFVSDVACPWCAVGLNALEQALQRLGPQLPVTLRFEPFELNPDMPPEGAETVAYLSAKYGIGAEQIARNQAVIRERGAAVGFHFGERPRVWNTFDAHRLLAWAGEGDASAQRALKHALLRAYHGEARNPGDPAVLLDLVAEVGLDGGRAREILAGNDHAGMVRERERHWQRLGITSVPSAVVDGRHLIQGAHPPEAYEQALRSLAAGDGQHRRA